MRRKSIAYLMAIVMLVTTFAFQFTAFAATDSGITVQFQNGNNSTSSNTIRATFDVKNTGSSPMNLANLKLRYYYTKDADKAQNFWCDHSGYMSGYNYIDVTSKVKGSFGSVSGSQTADTYLEVTFSSDAGNLPAGGSITIQTRVARTDWTNYDQSNDYSFKAAGSLVDWDHVTAYVSGALKYGIEPNGGSQPSAPKISPESATFDKAAPTDISVALTPNGNTFKGITGLTSGTDYTVSGNNVTISKSKLATYATGTTQSFTFDFGVSSNPVLSVVIKDSGSSTSSLKATIGTATGKVGDTVVIPVTLADVAKAGKVGTFGFNINYDKSVLEAVKVEAGDVVVNPSVNFSSQINAGSISFLFLDNTIGSELIEKDGVVANITFKIIGSSSSATPVTFKDGAVFGDANMAKIKDVKLTNGSVTISIPVGKTLEATIGTGSGKAGDTVVIPVTLANVADAGKVGTFGFNINYDKSLLEAVKVEAGDVVVNPSVNFSSQINAGSISFLFLDNTIGSELIEKDGVVANITFKVLGTSETTTSVSFKDGAVFGDASMAKIAKVTLTNGSVKIGTGPIVVPGALSATIGTAEGKAGDTVVVPVTLADVADAGKVGTFGFNINYDKSLLEAVKVEAGDVVVNPSVNFSSQINAGSISFLFLDNTIGSELIEKDGVVANITFKVLGTSEATTALTFKDGAVFGDASMAKISKVNLTAGSVKISTGTVVVKDPVINPTSASFDKAAPADVAVTVTANGNTFKGITGLTKDTDYTVSGDTVTILKSKLAGYDKDTVQSFTFDFGVTNNPVLTVKITDSTVVVTEALSATIGTAEGKAGDTVVVPVTLANVAKAGKVGTFGFNVNYDKSLLEAVKVEAGDVVVNPSVNFSSQINAGSISFLFLDNTIGSELIEKDGVVAKITFKVLGTDSATTPVTFKDGSVFGDANMAKIAKVDLKTGSVTIDKSVVIGTPSISPATATFQEGSASDIAVAVTANGNTFAGITGLTKGTDYTVSGDTVTISKSYLNGLAAGTKTLTFDFGTASATLTLTITSKAVEIKGLGVTIGTAAGKAGETITIPVTLKNVEKAGKVGTFGFTLNYDSTLLEASKVEAGSIVTSPSVNFSSQIKAGSVTFLFLDNTIGDQLITSDGVVANITFKVLGSSSVSAPITFKDGAVFGDANMSKISDVTLTAGSAQLN